MVEADLHRKGLRDLDHVGQGIPRRRPRSRARLCRHLLGAAARPDHGGSAGTAGRGRLVMTPNAQDLLNACIMTLATPPRPEDAGMFAAARIRLVALTNRLVAMETLDAAAVRMRENAALRALLAEAGPVHGIAAADLGDDGDYSLAALD